MMILITILMWKKVSINKSFESEGYILQLTAKLEALIIKDALSSQSFFKIKTWFDCSHTFYPNFNAHPVRVWFCAPDQHTWDFSGNCYQ